SHLVYCSSLWYPNYKTDCDLLERVQKKFLRLLEFKLGRTHIQGNYTWVMCNFHINSLETHRIISDISFLRGLINGEIDNACLLEKLSFIVIAD
ncbi:hypothetical protein, partial [Enterobacter cloacae complex sp. 2DZ2F20B]|uniref:hypothetical protein n=1 Tax=Enterobacter cloacae complex sp. 2DZ2F20B TaxID=2511993 RepID=UPI001CA49761